MGVSILKRSNEYLDTQIRTASQKSAVKQEDPVWKLLWANAHFIGTFGAVFLFICCGNGVPIPLFLSTAPLLIGTTVPTIDNLLQHLYLWVQSEYIQIKPTPLPVMYRSVF